MASDRATSWLSPAEMAEECDVSTDTLRYYEREQLLVSVSRSRGGQRRYSADDVGWVKVLRCLRVTALPIREMRRFAEFVRAGDAGVEGRLALLRQHRAEVERQIHAMQDALATIDRKIDWYQRDMDRVPDVDTRGVSTTPTLGGKGIRAS
jgi:DNA-binding transcriptional MerR regulator